MNETSRERRSNLATAVKDLQLRTERIGVTKEDLKQELKAYATKEDMREEGERTRRHVDMRFEQLRDEIRVMGDGWRATEEKAERCRKDHLALEARVERHRLDHIDLDRRVKRLEEAPRPRKPRS